MHRHDRTIKSVKTKTKGGQTWREGGKTHLGTLVDDQIALFGVKHDPARRPYVRGDAQPPHARQHLERTVLGLEAGA
jgi:hypothetical protein